jgi:hemoglobin
MKKDIENKQDIELLINSFYDKVRKDPMIGYIFEDVAKVDWERHLPVMYSFWDSVLFMKGGYGGNPMVVHQSLHLRHPLTKEHFDRWYSIFRETVKNHFEGEVAERALQRALSISTMMQIRIGGN